MTDAIKKGDKVKWNTTQGKTSGTVKKKITGPADIKGHHVAASNENPEFLVESDNSHAQATHKGSALKKK
ncbi:MAG: DUF2945 domain-containing protein [Burkholderiales bacterium]|nr:DUF2945 domain-containing protein [Burkholderiales bacterium]